MSGWKDKGVEIDLCLIGSKAVSFFRNYGGNVIAAITHIGDSPSIGDLIGWSESDARQLR